MKKLLSILISAIVVVSIASGATFAANKQQSETVDSTEFSISRSQLSPEKQKILDQWLQEKEAGKSNDLHVGQTKEVGRDSSGGIMYVTVTDEWESQVTLTS